MRKNKTWEITLTDNARLVANEPIENAVVYTTDTEAYLNFRVIDSGFEFDSATIAMINKDDGSIVERSMTKEDDTAVYEIESDIIPHFGLWQAQVLFKQGEEIFTSTPVTFVIERYMVTEQQPARLEDVMNWQRLYTNAVETIQDLTQVNADIEAIEQAEAQRAIAEQEREQGYQEIQQIIEDGSLIAEPADGSLTTAKYADKSVTEDKTNFINYSVNLFNKDTVHKEIGGYYSGRDFIEKANMDTFFVRVRPGTIITTNTSASSSIAFWDENFNYVDYVIYSQTMSVPDNNNIVWVSLPVLTTLNVDEIMVVEGESLPTTYVPFKHTLSNYIGISSGALEPLVDKGIVSRNIFNKDTVRIGYEVNGNLLRVTAQGDSATSANINVDGMSNIYLSGLPTYNVGGAASLGRDRYFAFYDENGEPLAGSLGTIPRSATEQLIDVPDNAHSFAFTIYQRKTTTEPIDVSKTMVEEGRTKSSFEPYKLGMVGIAGYRFETGTPDETLPTEGKVGLFFGDSITQTAVVSDDGVEYDEGRRSNWPKFAYDMLKLGDMWNYAQSGASFKDRSLEPRQYLGHQVDTAINNDRPADIIVVSCGTNDGAEAIGDYDIAMSKGSLSELDVTKLYESIRYSFWKLRTFYPNATMYAALPIQRVAREQPEELIEAITKMAHRYNFIIIDGLRESGIVRDFEVSGGNGRYLEDGLHPNVDGQIKIAKLYSRVIKNTYMP